MELRWKCLIQCLKDVEVMKHNVTEHRSDKCIVRVHKPILTDDERKAREEDVKTALVQFGRERMRNKNV